MDYQQALDYIYSFVDYEKISGLQYSAANYDLRRVYELLEALGNPHLGARSVHIAGTKGKGSVAAMMASALTTSGYVTGLNTSPHLHTLNERIRVDGRLIDDAELVSLTERLKPEAEAVNRRATYGRLTTFELLTVLAFMFFKLKGVEVQVMETGMGGRLDATNVIFPEVAVVTSIGLDHMYALGNTLAEIAGEKAGIIKPGIVVVSSPQAGEADRVISETCVKRGAELVRVGRDVTWQSLGFDFNRQAFRVKGRLGEYELSIPLLGHYQLDNAAAAVAALEVLAERGFTVLHDDIVDGLAKVDWPGRFQILGQDPVLVVDGAHNPGAARKLRESLEQYFRFDRAILVIGMSEDKDLAGIASELSPVFDKVIATHSRHPRAMSTEPIVAEFKRRGADVQAAADISAALSLARSLAGAGDLICVAGSLFIAAEAIEHTKLNVTY